MRDPARIPPIMHLLQAKWEEYPNLRFGQLIINILSNMQEDLFFIEDDVWPGIIESFDIIPGKYRGEPRDPI